VRAGGTLMMTYDPRTEQVLLTGGAGNERDNEVWALDADGWTMLTNDSGGAPANARAAFDVDRGEWVRFGVQNQTQGQTWLGAAGPYIADQPRSVSAEAGAMAAFAVTGVGSNVRYQWRKNGVELDGETRNVLIIESAGEADQGEYDCIATRGCGSAVSEPATLTVTGGNPADLNGDGFVNATDLANMLGSWSDGQ